MRKSIFASIALATTCLFTSCFDGDEDQHSGSAFFTVTGTRTEGYTLFADGGGKMIPTGASVSELTNGKGLDGIERVYLSYTFQEKDLSADRNTITGARLISGETLPVYSPITMAEAQEKNVLAEDSLYSVTQVTGGWAYRGYLTLSYRAKYSWNEKKDGYLYPRINMVVDDSQKIPNQINATLCHNECRPKSISGAAGEKVFTQSFRLADLANFTPITDSLRMSISIKGIDKPIEIKIAQEDLVKSNWR